MRAAVLHAPGDATLDLRGDVATLSPDSGEVRVRVKATGVCHSDLSAMTGVLPVGVPAVLGHEGAGEVVEVGSHVTSVQPGDHVVVSWTPACGTCPECRRGQPYLCITYVIEGFTKPRFTFGDGTAAFGMAGTGTWAEELVVPWQGVIKIDPDVPYEYAALLGCGIPTGVGAAINTARVKPGSAVAVVGCGGVGLAVIQGAKIAGAVKILAVDPLESKHGQARRFGATHVCTPDGLDQAKFEVTGGQGFDYAFEVVGKSGAIRTAWQLARRGGDVIVVGAGAADDNVPLSAFELLFEGKNILSSLYGGSDLRYDVGRFVDLWRAGLLDIEGLISRRIKFDELNDAVTSLANGEVVRQIVTFD
ncbi:MAG TPA: alcohol dehydrogenase catalytic domain-containing protein [Streptosporangiaceae bacterium]|nr:alcohol dehydrogenase catalytic domain-containing protein [Streptosporangiaceae bacterium]